MMAFQAKIKQRWLCSDFLELVFVVLVTTALIGLMIGCIIHWSWWLIFLPCIVPAIMFIIVQMLEIIIRRV